MKRAQFVTSVPPRGKVMNHGSGSLTSQVMETVHVIFAMNVSDSTVNGKVAR